MESLRLWRNGFSTLAILLLGACASVPPPAACFTHLSDAVGWTRLPNPPGAAVDMRKSAHEDLASKPESHPIEYWFHHFDGIVMLCEPNKRGCGASTTLFDKDESGAAVKSGGFELVCVTGT
jgi:hypothetical protein